jgi:hypothetical protein
VAWWQDIRVEAGEYSVKAVLKDGRAWVVRPTRFSSILSNTIFEYLDSGRTNAYQRQELAAAVAGLRKVGPQGRKQTRARYSPRVPKQVA